LIDWIRFFIMRFSLWKGGYSKLDFSTKPACRLLWD
jgi:hypothetical protein